MIYMCNVGTPCPCIYILKPSLQLKLLTGRAGIPRCSHRICVSAFQPSRLGVGGRYGYDLFRVAISADAVCETKIPSTGGLPSVWTP